MQLEDRAEHGPKAQLPPRPQKDRRLPGLHRGSSGPGTCRSASRHEQRKQPQGARAGAHLYELGHQILVIDTGK